MNEFERLVHDFMENCGYTEREAIEATIKTLNNK